MSNKKNVRFQLVLSNDERVILKEIATKWDCSESYVFRKGIKIIYELEFHKESTEK